MAPENPSASEQPLLEPTSPIAKLQDQMSEVLTGLSRLASKHDLAELSRTVAVATSRITSLEQHQGTTSSSAPSAPRLGGGGILRSPSATGPSSPPPHTTEQPDTGSATGVPRFYKLEFPKYDGKEDPLNWFNHCEQFFRGQKTPATDWVWLATYHLTGDAQEWYFHYEIHHGPPTWEEFKDLCHGHFGPPIHRNPLGEMKRLMQTSSVAVYQTKFLALASRTFEALSDKQQIQLFTAGLRDELAVDVELHQPDDLQEAMSLARAYERKASKLGNASRPPPRQPFRNVASTSALANSALPGTDAMVDATPRQFRRLSPAELAERRRQGLCYNCDEKFVRDHKCARLFHIEYDETASDDDAAPAGDADTDEPRVSLNALSGVDGANTMRLPVHVGGEHVIALVDSGSTHNFINTQLARHLRCPLAPVREDLRVVVANGDRLASPGLCRDLPLTIDGERFHVDCFVLEVYAVDIILGTEWLRSLGPILWNFRNMRMAIWRGTREVTLYGLADRRTPHCAALAAEDLLPRVLEEFAVTP
jgi:hypothetical protein